LADGVSMRDVLVTGASGGIGSAVAGVLTSSGHRVIAVGRDSDRLERLSSDGARVIAVDLAYVGGLRAAVRDIDHLDALIHCAGVSAVASVADTDPATWQDILTVNVTAAAELTRLLLPALRRSHGHVIFVNASPGMRAVPRWAAFVGSKAALRELADSLRFEEATHGVRVTTVYPAGTATERLRSIRAAFDRPYEPARCIQPDSLAEMIAWVLAAPPDSYVTELSVHPAP
jgi:NADP-dependent 3-hydroxy acid dehydrogenase YdfG